MKTIEAPPGEHISVAIRSAIEQATIADWIRFEFNGVEVVVAHDSDHDLILRDFRRTIRGYIHGPVGPYPEESLSLAALKADLEAQKVIDRREEEEARRTRMEEEARRTRMEERLSQLPEIHLRDPHGWAEAITTNAGSPYGMGVIRYAERLARLMQEGLARGTGFDEIAETASYEADIDGITGFMYGCAVNILYHVWVHGEQLRTWHNAKYGKTSGNGVVNT